jgi:hypothetical protein
VAVLIGLAQVARVAAPACVAFASRSNACSAVRVKDALAEIEHP